MQTTVTVKSAGPREVAPRCFRFTASTSDTDREGDRLIASGWELENYRRNPVILVLHERRKLPVAKAARVWVEGERLMVDVEFPEPGISPAADEAHGLVRGGFLRAVSVGFRPIEGTPMPGGGMCWSRIELLEISLVSVPAHQDAVAAALGGGKRAAAPDQMITIVDIPSPGELAAMTRDPEAEARAQLAYLATRAGQAALVGEVKAAVRAEFRRVTGRLD